MGLDTIEACVLPVGLCGWLTEGFDTVELVDAKALLKELA